MFSARRRVLLSEHVSPTIRIRYDDAIRPNTNRLFRPLFGTEADTNRIFSTSLKFIHLNGDLPVLIGFCFSFISIVRLA